MLKCKSCFCSQPRINYYFTLVRWAPENSLDNFVKELLFLLTGLAGSNLWEETLCDLLVETCLDAFHDVPTKIYMWKVFKREPEPENSAKVMEEVKQRITKGLGYIQSVAEKKGKKFLVCDTVS